MPADERRCGIPIMRSTVPFCYRSGKEFRGNKVFAALFAAFVVLLMSGEFKLASATDETIASVNKAMEEGRFKDAIGLCSEAIKLDPKQSSLYFQRARAYEMINQFDKAVDDLNRAIELDPLNSEAMEALAEVYETRFSRFSDSLRLYKQAAEIVQDPYAGKRLQANIAVLENRLQKDDTSAVRCWHWGNIKAAAGDLSKAERYYTQAIRLDPAMFQAYFSRGLLRMKADRAKDALKDFEEAIKLSPSLRGAYMQKGLANQQIGNIEQAHRDFENAATMDPHDPYAQFYFGLVLETGKDFQDALQHYNEALTRNPKPELRKMIQERISALDPMRKSDSKNNADRKTKDLW